MKNRKKTQRNRSVPTSRRLSFITMTIAAVVLVGAAITVLSRQVNNRNGSPVVPVEKAKPATAHSDKKYVTVKVAGRQVQVDPQTGKIKPLTPDEAKQLADGLKAMLNKSTNGLEQVQNADGSVSMDLEGRFQNVTVARVNDDGTVEQSCIDEPQQAARFFGIDPKLLDVKPAEGVTTQPVVRTPARKVSR